MTGGVAHAAPTTPAVANGAHANQEWFGPYWYYLGNYSGAGYSGHIHTFNSPHLCLEVPGWAFYGFLNSSNDPSGVQVQLWDCEPNDFTHDWDLNQLWQQKDNGDPQHTWSYYVTNNLGSFCLDSLTGHHYNGSPVEVYPCNGDDAQKWTIGWSGQLQSVDSPGYCLDDTNWNPNDGAQMQLWQCAY